VCIWCEGIPQLGKFLCTVCTAEQAVRAKKANEDKKARGLCTHCRTTPVIKGMTLCEGCTEDNKDRCKQYNQGRKSSGICLRCPNPALLGQVHCLTCSEKVNINTEKRIQSLSAKNICRTCATNPCIEGNSRCFDCHERNKIQCSDRSKGLKEKGLCIRCGLIKPDEGKVTCQSCLKNGAARWTERANCDPVFRLANTLRSRLRTALRQRSKTGSAVRDLGCSIEELWSKLESQFQIGMTRDNHSTVWEIDHIRPLASFDLSDPEQLKLAVHFSNLQPMFCKENKSKGSSHEGQRARFK
jgi:hypothetical protein